MVTPAKRFRKCRILALSTGLTAYNYKRPRRFSRPVTGHT